MKLLASLITVLLFLSPTWVYLMGKKDLGVPGRMPTIPDLKSLAIVQPILLVAVILFLWVIWVSSRKQCP